MEKFCLSYSTGKDSVLALDRMITAGYQCAGLVTSVSEDINRSWFHGIPLSLLEQAAESLQIPLVVVKNNPENYQERMVTSLRKMKKSGIDYCVFGDIDIEENGQWDRNVCQKSGLKPLLPLWEESREEIVTDFVEKGYHAIIKTISKASRIPDRFLGQPLDQTFIDYLNTHDIDVCGENGEYHTFVVDGPLFKFPINYQTTGIFESEYSKSIIIEN